MSKAILLPEDGSISGGTSYPGFQLNNYWSRQSPPIQPVGSAYSGTGSTSSWTLAVTPVTVGDILAVSTANYSTKTLSSVSGGGVTTWHVVGNATNSNDSCGLAWGIVTTAGSSNVTMTMSGTAAGVSSAGEFSTTFGTFAADGSGGTANNSSTSITGPSLTPAGTQEMYLMGIYLAGGVLSIPAGYSYFPGIAFGAGTGIIYNNSVSAVNGAQAPVISVNTGKNCVVAQLIQV